MRMRPTRKRSKMRAVSAPMMMPIDSSSMFFSFECELTTASGVAFVPTLVPPERMTKNMRNNMVFLSKE